MGLFNLLKNGLTIEKKKVPAQSEQDIAEKEQEAATEEAEVEESEEDTAPEATTASTQPTLEAQRQEAASVLLGDNGLTGGATPSLIQVAPTTQAPQAATPTPVAQPLPTEAPVQQPQIFNTHNNTGNFDSALLGQVSANQNLLVIAPQTPAEISTILTNLANGNACIVSLSKFPLAEGQRFLDYICGFVNAIGGMIMQKTSTEYILAPKGVNIKNS